MQIYVRPKIFRFFLFSPVLFHVCTRLRCFPSRKRGRVASRRRAEAETTCDGAQGGAAANQRLPPFYSAGRAEGTHLSHVRTHLDENRKKRRLEWGNSQSASAYEDKTQSCRGLNNAPKQIKVD